MYVVEKKKDSKSMLSLKLRQQKQGNFMVHSTKNDKKNQIKLYEIKDKNHVENL